MQVKYFFFLFQEILNIEIEWK